MGTLTGPRGLVVACVTDRRLLWSAVSAPAECSSLDANTRGLQLTTLAACHCRVRPAPLRPLTRVSAYSVSVGRFCGLCGWRPLLTDDSTGSHLLLSPPRAIWGAGTAQDRKKATLTTCSSPTHVPPRLLHDGAGAPPLCGRCVLKTSFLLIRFKKNPAKYDAFGPNHGGAFRPFDCGRTT